MGVFSVIAGVEGLEEIHLSDVGYGGFEPSGLSRLGKIRGLARLGLVIGRFDRATLEHLKTLNREMKLDLSLVCTVNASDAAALCETVRVVALKVAARAGTAPAAASLPNLVRLYVEQVDLNDLNRFLSATVKLESLGIGSMRSGEPGTVRLPKGLRHLIRPLPDLCCD